MSQKTANEAVKKRLPMLRKMAREHDMEFRQSSYVDYWDYIHLLFTSEVKGRKAGGLINVKPEFLTSRAFSAKFRAELVELKKSFKALNKTTKRRVGQP